MNEIKNIMKEHHIPQWKVAERLGIHENTLHRQLRNEEDLSSDMKESIRKTVTDLIYESKVH